MSRLFIIEDTTTPALYGITASYLANQQQRPLWSLKPTFSGDYPDSHQHVCRAGYCVTSGLYTSQTFQHEVVATNELERTPDNAVIVLSRSDIRHIAGLNGECYSSQHTESHLQLLNARHQVILSLNVDHYGRWMTTLPKTYLRTLNIAMIGRPTDHHHVYPAVLSALGDAAETLLTQVNITFFPPASLSDNLDELLPYSGIILPGGTAFETTVNGQIRVAAATLTRSIPTFGLCLGMQSMTTALLRQHDACRMAMLQEVDPQATVFSFSRFPDRRHRCGILSITPTGKLAAHMPAGQLHYNHRYRFSPEYRPMLRTTGVEITAQTDEIIDAISMAEHPFWHGLQGHPELSSRAGAPHPLFTAFLQAALNQQA